MKEKDCKHYDQFCFKFRTSGMSILIDEFEALPHQLHHACYRRVWCNPKTLDGSNQLIISKYTLEGPEEATGT